MDCEPYNIYSPDFSISSSDGQISKYKLIDPISKSNFPVYLAKREDNATQVAIKFFPHNKDGSYNKSYLNEKKFHGLNHQYIIKLIECQDYTDIEPYFMDYSAIITEYAKCGPFIVSHIAKDEVLVRTYFHQLIEGIEHFHNNGIAHLDLKCQNLLMGDDANLKIIDFDQSNFIKTEALIGRGTEDFRAPEVIYDENASLKEVDIYSAGIILFTFKYGYEPYHEGQLFEGRDLRKLLLFDPENFWILQSVKQGKSLCPSEGFKKLFEQMTRFTPEMRPTIEDIKKNEWYNGPIYKY